MRDTLNLAAILDAINAAKPIAPPVESVSILSPLPGLARGAALARNGRAEVLSNLAQLLASATDTPDWMSRMALDAVVVAGAEGDLDGPINHLPILERAALAMGIDPACIGRGKGRAH